MSTSPSPAEDASGAKYLVVGFGNSLRGDDGLGLLVIEELAPVLSSRQDVRLIGMPQLDLTLAFEMVQAGTVIFVDARVDDDEERVRVHRVAPAPDPFTQPHSSHTVTIPVLLRIVQEWYGHVPECWLVTPRGTQLSLGFGISGPAREAAAAAKEAVLSLLLK